MTYDEYCDALEQEILANKRARALACARSPEKDEPNEPMDQDPDSTTRGPNRRRRSNQCPCGSPITLWSCIDYMMQGGWSCEGNLLDEEASEASTETSPNDTPSTTW